VCRRALKAVCLPVILTGGFAANVAAATINVPPSGNLQTALDTANPGDVIVLQAGARYVGTFRLPAKPAGPVITIQSSATLPNRRIGPQDASLLPTIAPNVVAAILDGTGAANWKLDGIRFESVLNGQGEVIVLQDSTNIYIDRVLIVAGPNGQKRGIRGNGQQITLTRSYIANIWRVGQDSQAFCAWDGAGPYTITDNYLEAASENIMFGGADSLSPARMPSDILVEGNYFTKQWGWRGQGVAVKNLFELKAGRRITIRRNVFERNWADAQTGYGILLKALNQDGSAPWSVLEDVLFENNVVRDTDNGFNILGNDYQYPSGRATRITIRNNLVLTTGVGFQLGGEIGMLTIDHNTIVNGGTLMSLYIGSVWNAGAPAPRTTNFAVEQLAYTNNMAYHNAYGVKGDGTAVGTPSLVGHTLNYYWANNVLAGGAGQPYPPTTWTPAVVDYQSQFDTDFRLVSGSIYCGAATDGRDLGVDWTQRLPLLQGPQRLRLAK